MKNFLLLLLWTVTVTICTSQDAFARKPKVPKPKPHLSVQARIVPGSAVPGIAGTVPNSSLQLAVTVILDSKSPSRIDLSRAIDSSAYIKVAKSLRNGSVYVDNISLQNLTPGTNSVR